MGVLSIVIPKKYHYFFPLWASFVYYYWTDS